MKNSQPFSVAGFLLFVAVLCSGCVSSQPSRFYTLSVTGADAEQQKPAGDRIAIGLSLIGIPDYLDRPQIVTRDSENQLNLAEFDRWAGSLREDISRVIAENLVSLLPQGSVIASQRGVPFQYRLTVDILRFDVMSEGVVYLKAQWRFAEKKSRSLLLLRESAFSEPVRGKDSAAKVAAMSKAVGRLSMEIAEGIKAVVSEGKAPDQGEKKEG